MRQRWGRELTAELMAQTIRMRIPRRLALTSRPSLRLSGWSLVVNNAAEIRHEGVEALRDREVD
eukprot:CAMPEP_0119477716 /NCGR_PEP_ID=MMETSP1344-20130328/7765_1 /TAXON_ID=236787 /ORGANISM="Florenciella parvula, Strain CCMP2471" /LENGTH=63 /DNA_ID=CAMNT_0007511791 /DNA_START=276 /DNA_END=467 /DNA_ORIENTATION=+